MMEKGKDRAGRLSFLKLLLTGAKDLLFPPTCPICEAPLGGAEGICAGCLSKISPISSPLCPLCGEELADSAAGDHLCGPCLRKPPPYSSARGLVQYREPVTSLLHRLKYQGDTSVLPGLRKIIESAPPVPLGSEDRVVPVPLHVGRLRKRGFNQALLLARLLFPGGKHHILINTLQRIRPTRPQTGLDGGARRKNLRNAFSVSDTAEIRGRRVFLVDDVYTSGTTVSECSRALLAGGAGEVHVLTLARVRRQVT